MVIGALTARDPQNIGRFRLTGRLGAGGMGVVYLGEDERGQQIAVKVLRTDLADDPERLRARFRREVAAAFRISGQCTARVVAADPEAEQPWFATEYVAGETLTRHIDDGGPLHGDALRGFAAGLAEALVAIHGAGLVHRDLKPSNVILAKQGPKVIDFGIAVERAGTAEELTRTGETMGSLGWMAPEQLAGGQVGPPVDVFAWGLLVAYAAGGHHPFGPAPSDAIVYRIRYDEPDLTALPAWAAPSVERALAKDPQARPDAGELERALLPGRPHDPADVATELHGLLTRAWALDTTQPRASSPAAPAAPRRRRVLIALATGLAVLLAAATAAGLYLATRGTHTRRASIEGTTVTRVSSSTSSPTGTTGAPAASSSTTVAARVATTLPLVDCPTTLGVDTTPAPLPSSIDIAIAASARSQLAAYSDSEGMLIVLAPRGWACAAAVGADGSAGIRVYPPGDAPPSDTGAFTPQPQQAVTATGIPACQGCVAYLVCPLFPQAPVALSYLPCRHTPPAGEAISRPTPSIAAFEDPPGVAGDGNPSGGAYPANGVIIFNNTREASAYAETCTLPGSEHNLCTAVLNDYIARHAR